MKRGRLRVSSLHWRPREREIDMKKMEKFTITIWRGSDGKGLIDLSCGDSGPGRWFICTIDELRSVCSGGIVRDGYHKLESAFEAWLFLDISDPFSADGEITIPAQCYSMPYEAQTELLAIVVDALEAYDVSAESISRYTGLPDGREKITLDLSSDLAIWNSWGRGTGTVRVVGDPEQIAQLAIDMWRSDSCSDMYDRLEAIARNSTYRPSDVGELRIGYDFAGYGFTAGGMVGGLINHGGEWSLHT